MRFQHYRPGWRALLVLALIILYLPLSATAEVAVLTVSGTIEDEEGIPLIGATIQEKGQGGGTVTDFDGTYTLEVSSGDAILVISYTGYATQEVAVNDRAIVNIVLDASAAILNEVVVVGYGTQKRRT